MDRRIEALRRRASESGEIQDYLNLALMLQRAGRLEEFYLTHYNGRSYRGVTNCWGHNIEHRVLDIMGEGGLLRRPNRKEMKAAIKLTTDDMPYGTIKHSTGRIQKHIHLSDNIMELLKQYHQSPSDDLDVEIGSKIEALYPFLLLSGAGIIVESLAEESLRSWRKNNPDHANCFIVDSSTDGDWQSTNDWGGDHTYIETLKKIAQPGDYFDIYLHDGDTLLDNIGMPIPWWVDPVTNKFIW
jgi:hypothetical protein